MSADLSPTPLSVLVAAPLKPDQLMLQKKLKSASGWALKTAVAADGKEALDHLKEAPYDLVVADAALAAETLPRIRQLHAKSAVVVVSERADAASAIESMKQGALDYLTHAELSALDMGKLFRRIIETRNLSTQNLELRQINQMKNEFIANISHELRTPLQVIVGWAQALKDKTLGPLNEDQAKAAGAILERTQSLITTVNQILRTREGAPDALQLKPLDLRQWLAALAKDPPRAAARKAIKLEISLPTAPLWVLAHAESLGEAVSNLLSNAFKFSPDASRVTLAAAAGEGEALISVSDEGPGVAPELMRRIFERFSAVSDSPTRSHTGLGLGLPLAREIVELHGGRLWLEPGAGKGTVVKLSLPLAAPDSPERQADRPPAVRKKRVLIVEDNADLVEVLRLFMSGISPNLAITAVTSGFEALRTVEAETPDLMIIDVMMPGISGLEVIDRLRRHPKAAAMPVLVLTGYPDAAERALRGGAKDVLLKPFEKEIFVKKVSKLLRGLEK